MNEKLSKRRIQIIDLQKKEIEEKQEIRLLIRLHIFYLIMESNGISIIISLISILASILLAIQKTALSWSSLNIQTSLSLNKSPTDTGLVYKRFPKLFKIKEKITNEASFNKIKFFGFTLFIFYSYIFKNRISITSSTEFSFPIQCYSNFQ